jgi:hypothetical protein
MKLETDAEAEWRAIEAGYRKALEEYLVLAKAAFQKEFRAKKKTSPLIIPLRLIYIDAEYKIPLAMFEFEMLGTRQELIRLIEANHRQLTNSPQCRKNQNRVFNHLKDQFGMKDKDSWICLFRTLQPTKEPLFTSG